MAEKIEVNLKGLDEVKGIFDAMTIFLDYGFHNELSLNHKAKVKSLLPKDVVEEYF